VGNDPESAPPAKSDPSIPDQIRQLGELRDQGLVTPEEFETKKTELLSRL
jgi:Short C-terminal domain